MSLNPFVNQVLSDLTPWFELQKFQCTGLNPFVNQVLSDTGMKLK